MQGGGKSRALQCPRSVADRQEREVQESRETLGIEGFVRESRLEDPPNDAWSPRKEASVAYVLIATCLSNLQ